MRRNPLAQVCQVEGYFPLWVVKLSELPTESCWPARTAGRHVHRSETGPNPALIWSKWILWWRTGWAILYGHHWAVVNWAVNPQHWWPSHNGCFVGNDPPGHSFVTDCNFWLEAFIWTNGKNRNLLLKWCDFQPCQVIISSWIKLFFYVQCNYFSMLAQ